MNIKNETLRTMQELGKQHPNYSLGDIIFASFQTLATQKGESLDFLRSISDEDFYNASETVLKREENE